MRHEKCVWRRPWPCHRLKLLAVLVYQALREVGVIANLFAAGITESKFKKLHSH
jgi:hypothetical protein